MRYLPLNTANQKALFKTIGIESFDQLLDSIPPAVRFKKPLGLEAAYSEHKLLHHFQDLAEKNHSHVKLFAGGGSYRHHIPAIVESLISRGEFLTAYTPYQPEISQGTLQAIFEFQTLACQLLEMDIANASMYDGATAFAEGLLQATRVTKREMIIIQKSLHPHYKQVLQTYYPFDPKKIIEIDFDRSGTVNCDLLHKEILAAGDRLAAVGVQYPNFFGIIEPIDKIKEIAAAAAPKALFVTSTTEAIAFGMLKPPGGFEADIATCEGQSFGNPIGFGGRCIGLYTVKDSYIRSMPGRVVGQTVDKDGRRSYTLTFETREQHIRREKATSNICTNHSLLALAAAIHMTSLGRQGLRKLAEMNFRAAEYAKSLFREKKTVKLKFSAPTFNEFCLETTEDVDMLFKRLIRGGILPGIRLKKFYPDLKSSFIVSFTELSSKSEIDEFVSCFQ